MTGDCIFIYSLIFLTFLSLPLASVASNAETLTRNKPWLSQKAFLTIYINLKSLASPDNPALFEFQFDDSDNPRETENRNQIRELGQELLRKYQELELKSKTFSKPQTPKGRALVDRYLESHSIKSLINKDAMLGFLKTNLRNRYPENSIEMKPGMTSRKLSDFTDEQKLQVTFNPPSSSEETLVVSWPKAPAPIKGHLKKTGKKGESQRKGKTL